MTDRNLVSHSDNNAIGSSLVVERCYPGRAGSPLVAAKYSDISPPIFGMQKERTTAFKQNLSRARTLITIYIPNSHIWDTDPI